MDQELKKALALLPHGPEFRFIDRLLSLVPGCSAQGEYAVKGYEPFLCGHFPGQPLFPGVLLVEAGAQLAGIAVQSDPKVKPFAGLKLTALRNIKITGSAKPGEVVRLEARITGRLANLVQVEVSASVNRQTVMEGALTLSGDPGARP